MIIGGAAPDTTTMCELLATTKALPHKGVAAAGQRALLGGGGRAIKKHLQRGMPGKKLPAGPQKSFARSFVVCPNRRCQRSHPRRCRPSTVTLSPAPAPRNRTQVRASFPPTRLQLAKPHKSHFSPSRFAKAASSTPLFTVVKLEVTISMNLILPLRIAQL
jgi:hypothetical protein